MYGFNNAFRPFHGAGCVLRRCMMQNTIVGHFA